jgi:ABC-2 type transport system ATP-binding protein
MRAGETVGLLGRNGAGKTTLLKIFSTLLVPSAGHLRICGEDPVAHPDRVRRHISVVFGGDRGLYPRLSALDNILFFAGISGVRQGLRQRSIDALDAVGLADRATSPVETYSKGMRQRLHLAIGLITRPRLLMLDEPTVGLDLVEAERVRVSVARLAASGTSVLLTSHYPADIDQLADRVVLLDQGTVAKDMSISLFRREAGFAAEIRVTGTGATPDAQTSIMALGESATIQVQPHGWHLTFQVISWDHTVLADLAVLLRDLDVQDIDVSTPGVEAVLRRSMATYA